MLVLVVQAFLERESIVPARSPDLNPKEHMWNELQVRVTARQLQPRTTKELGAMLVQEWADIPVKTARHLFQIMR
jgi:hypothetical protein